MKVVDFQYHKRLKEKKSNYILSFFKPGKMNSVNHILNSTQTFESSSAVHRLQAGQAAGANPALGLPRGLLRDRAPGSMRGREPGAAWRKCPDWVSSTETPQVGRSLELPWCPAGRRRGVSDSTTSLQLMESDTPTAPHTCEVWNSQLLRAWQLIKAWSKYVWEELRQSVKTLDLSPLTAWGMLRTPHTAW